MMAPSRGLGNLWCSCKVAITCQAVENFWAPVLCVVLFISLLLATGCGCVHAGGVGHYLTAETALAAQRKSCLQLCYNLHPHHLLHCIYKITISSSLLCCMSLSVKGGLLTPWATWKFSAGFYCLYCCVCRAGAAAGENTPTAKTHGSLIHNITLFEIKTCLRLFP